MEASSTLEEADELSVEKLGDVVYEVVFYQLMRLSEQYSFAPEKNNQVKVDFAQQREEYMTKVDCFGADNIDRFFAAQRLAETNVIAANELASIYSHGRRFVSLDGEGGNDGFYQVEADRNLAVRYIKKAVSSEPMLPDACWFLGDMIWKKQFMDVGEEEREELALSYFYYAMKRDFIPAYNSIGVIEISRGDRLLEKSLQSNKEGALLPECDWQEMICHYRKGLELCDKAGCMGWVYGHINVAKFLADERYGDRIWPAIKELAVLQGPVDLRERWKAAADMGSLWAMNSLAFLDFRQNRILSAVEIWKQAAESHYPAASLNLALRIYGPGCPQDDKQLYRTYLKKAAADGSARASCELALLYMESDPARAEMLLVQAEEQNSKKFNKELHRKLQEIHKNINLS